MTKLKPCPFCGGEPKIEHVIIDRKKTMYIYCANNGCEVNLETRGWKSRLIAIKRWNTRAELS